MKITFACCFRVSLFFLSWILDSAILNLLIEVCSISVHHNNCTNQMNMIIGHFYKEMISNLFLDIPQISKTQIFNNNK